MEESKIKVKKFKPLKTVSETGDRNKIYTKILTKEGYEDVIVIDRYTLSKDMETMLFTCKGLPVKTYGEGEDMIILWHWKSLFKRSTWEALNNLITE